VVVAGGDVGGQRPERVERRFETVGEFFTIFSTSSSMDELTAELPMLVLIFTSNRYR